MEDVNVEQHWFGLWLVKAGVSIVLLSPVVLLSGRTLNGAPGRYPAIVSEP